MKNKLIILLAITALFTGLLTGCGGNSPVGNTRKEITVSELLSNQMKENDGKVYMFTGLLAAKGLTVDSAIAEGILTTNFVYEYDGTVARKMVYGRNFVNYGEILSNISSLKEEESYNAKLYAAYHDGGEPNESIMITDDGTDIDFTTGDYEVLRFWHMGDKPITYHVEIDGESYIVIDSKERGESGSHHFTIMKDTAYTKDKTVIVDSIDSSKSFKDGVGRNWVHLDIEY